MRILVVTNLYPSKEDPSFGTFVAERVAQLRSVGAEVEVVAMRSPDVHQRVVQKYARLAIHAAVSALRLALTRRRPEIVEAHIAFPTGLIAWPIARLLGAHLVLFAHGADVRDVAWRSIRARFLARRLLSSADLVIANSEFLARFIRVRFKVREGSPLVISPGVALAPFVASARRKREGILFVGRLIPEKGGRELLEAVHSLGRTLLLSWSPVISIIGAGPERRGLEELARKLDLDVEFLGAVHRHTVATSMGRAAVVVVPSVYEEPLGLVAIEAMASGAVVVASSIGGLSETIRDGVNGFTSIAGDVESLAHALRRAIDAVGEPDFLQKLRAAGRRTARQHDIQRSVAASLRAYETLARR